jgi:hypothetical protein
MPVHGVKGELLTRNRIVVPLAAACRECRYFFPLRPSIHFAPIVRRARHCRSISRFRGCLESRAGSWAHSSIPKGVGRHVDRILSIERSASGAGKKAAYDAFSHCEATPYGGEVDDLAGRCRLFGGSIGTRVIATFTPRHVGTHLMWHVCASESRALSIATMRARAPIEVENETWLPLKLNRRFENKRTKNKKGARERCTETLGERCHDQDC